MILLLKIKKECSEHSTSDWKIVLNNWFLPLLTSIGDKFSRFEKLLSISCILAFQMSSTLKMAYFSILP